jgi:hypothetical protein
MSLFVVRAIYLGSEPMGELLDGENGSDAVQVPLKRTILRTNGIGDEVDLIITDDSLYINHLKANNSISNSNDNIKAKLIQLPIETLAYCGALKQLQPENINDREFETLDKTPVNSKVADDPPLFVTIFRSLEKENTLLCHSFVIRKDTEAMELVKNVMQVYYNIIEQLEQTEALFNSSITNNNLLSNNNSNNNNNISNEENVTIETLSNKSQVSLTQAELDRLLKTYNLTGDDILTHNQQQQATQSILNNHGSSQFVVNQNIPKDFLVNNVINNSIHNLAVENNNDKPLDPSQYSQIIKDAINQHSAEHADIPLNQDDDPIIIKKKNEEKLIYKQNVYIRWLQPPTPPPPAPIIIREVQDEPAEELPPVIIYKQAPRAPTPPPLVIREKPPTPVEVGEPIVIERRVPAPKPEARRVVVEEIPAPPAKPRDIILEKWLPRDANVVKRPVVLEKLKEKPPKPPVYDYVETKPAIYQTHQHYDYHYDPKYTYHYRQQPAPTYDVINDKVKTGKRVVKQIIRPEPRYYDYTDNYHHQSIPAGYNVYNSHNQYQYQYPNQYQNTYNVPKYNKPNIAGYRIIRQIIPGPNATSADIQKAILRSQKIGQQSNSRKYTDSYREFSTQRGISVDRKHSTHKTTSK